MVAVTGAASFLGSHLVGLLEEDPRIRRIICLDEEETNAAGDKTLSYALDLTHPHAAQQVGSLLQSENVDTVVHLAFLATPTHSTAWAHELESVGTMHLLNACHQTKVRKLVMWSRTQLYGAQPTNPNFLTERHPLRADRTEPFFQDKIEAEAQLRRFGLPGTGRVATILRTAPILGPSVRNYVTRYLGRRLVPTILGFDPLWQFLHEADAVSAFKRAIDTDATGTFNITGDGVLPLSTVIKLAGRIPLHLPKMLAQPLLKGLWATQLTDVPPSFLSYLQYLCIADGALAKQSLGFIPHYSTRETLLDYASAQHLRDADLLADPAH